MLYNFAWQSFAICAQLVLMYDMKSINKLRCAAAGASSTSAASPNITDFPIYICRTRTCHGDDNICVSWRSKSN